VSWWFSLLFIIPLLAIFGTLLWGQFFSGTPVEGRVFDAYTGEGVGDARVELGNRATTTSSDGSFGIRNTDAGTIVVSLDGYDSATYELPTSS
jgi:hypothetical protein